MNLKNLTDHEVLQQTKKLTQDERHLLTKILHHLKEVDRRKLFCDLKYQSLFEYAVKELKYSEGQAGRRIQAMRLIKELPEVEKKIQTGKLSLSNISQAHSYFREANKLNPQKQIDSKEKMEVLNSLENKSVREGQKTLLKLMPEKAIPKERERIITENHTEVRFVMTNELKSQLSELRALIGPKGGQMNLAELIARMTQLSIKSLKVKRFGKKRVEAESRGGGSPKSTLKSTLESTLKRKASLENRSAGSYSNSEASSGTPAKTPSGAPAKADSGTPAPECRSSKSSRYISKAIRHKIWQRDGNKCTLCKSQKNLNIDHVQPVAFGGDSSIENLRLLCFHCNQRQAMKALGVQRVNRHYHAPQ